MKPIGGEQYNKGTSPCIEITIVHSFLYRMCSVQLYPASCTGCAVYNCTQLPVQDVQCTIVPSFLYRMCSVQLYPASCTGCAVYNCTQLPVQDSVYNCTQLPVQDSVYNCRFCSQYYINYRDQGLSNNRVVRLYHPL